MRVFGDRLVEVYGRHTAEDRRFFIGYISGEFPKGPGLDYARDHVSDATGLYLRTVWEDELKGWVMEFGPPPCLNIEGTNPGTIPGTISDQNLISRWD